MDENQIAELKRALQASEARVNVLENELAKKTEVLENTEAVLSNSQQQYKELLMRLSEMSQQQKTKVVDETKIIELQNQIELNKAQMEKQTNLISEQREKIELLQIENEKLKQSVQFYAEKSSIQVPRNAEDRIQKSIYQLRQAQEDILDLRAENENLKYQISTMKREDKAWEEFGYDIYHELSRFCDTNMPLPRDNPRLLRNQLRDLIMDMASRNTNKNFAYRSDDSEYKYKEAKKSLKEVQHRCDRMLNILGEEESCRYHSDQPYYHYRPERYSNREYHERNIATRENEDVVIKEKKKTVNTKQFDRTNTDELNRYIHELHGITKQIKGDYRQLFQ